MLFVLLPLAFLLLPGGANAAARLQRRDGEDDSPPPIGTAVIAGTLTVFVLLAAVILVVWSYSRRLHARRDGATTPVVWKSDSNLLLPLTAPSPPPSSPLPPPAAHSPTRTLAICSNHDLCLAQAVQPRPLLSSQSRQLAGTSVAGVAGAGAEDGAHKFDAPKVAPTDGAHSRSGSPGAVSISRWI